MARVTWSSQSLQQPSFAAEELTPLTLIPGGARIDPNQFGAADSQTLTLAAGAVAAGANRSLTLTTALRNDIPPGYVLDFGDGEFCTLVNGGLSGATALSNVTVAAALEGGESATYRGISSRKPIEAGLLVGRTLAERDSRSPYGPADVATDEQIFLIAFGAIDANINNDVTLLRHGTLIYEDQLPGWATMAAPVRSAIRARYQCIRSAY